jgi:hypothetical protein
MLEWFEEALQTGEVSPGPLAARLGLSLVLGGVVAGIYALTQRKFRSDLAPFATTLVLLTVLIAMVTLVIGNNVARAFSLAGALAIIRFRTVVEDTRDTAFVIFAVVVGMGVGAGLAVIPLAGIPVVGAAAFLLSHWGPPNVPAAGAFSLDIRLGIGHDPDVLFRETFGKHLELARLRAMTTARQGSALDLSYLIRLRREEDAVAFVYELNQVEGVQNIELRQL